MSYLARLYESFRSGKASTPPTRERMLVEAIEPRILHSADISPLQILAPDAEPVAEVRILDSSGEFILDGDAVSQEQARAIVFVDTSTPDYEQLINQIISQSDNTDALEVILIESQNDGLDQISNVLASRDDLTAVHIISHGSDGNVELGSSNLTSESLTQRASEIAGWANAFSESGDILIYGCDLASSEIGKGLVADLALLTGADVAASDDLTGHESLGGDWDLEVQTGAIESAVIVDARTQSTWKEVLAAETLVDNFDAVSYSNNDGTQTWTTDWVETDSGGTGESGGEIFVDGTDLRVRARNDGDNIYREADLSGATAATLTFDVVDNRLANSDVVRLEVSNDGGGSWTTLKDFTAADPGTSSESFDITASIAADTRVRFLVVGNGDERIHLDNIQIDYVAGPDITTGLLGHWTFDADASDDSGNGNDGTLQGDAAIDTTDGTDKIGVAKLSLDGSGDYVDLSANISSFSGLTEGTISAWINTTDTGESIIFSLSDQDQNTELVKFGIEGGQLKWLNINDSGGYVIGYSDALVNDGAWHHVAVSVGASGNTLYIDGSVASVSYIGGDSTSSTFFSDVTDADVVDIGRSVRFGSVEGEYNGLMDDVRLYGRALTAADTAELASANHAPVAVNDAAVTNQNTAVVINVTANDTDQENDAITIVEVSSAANGTVVNNNDGTITYTPDTNFTGVDSFEYAIIDSTAGLQNYWGLDGDGNDAVGAANGTLTGTTTVAGSIGNGLSFNETSDQVNIPDVSYASEFTISFDFKVDEINGSLFQYLYSHGDINSTNSISIFINEDAHGTDPNVLRTVIRDTNDTLDNAALQFDISALVGDSQWHTYTVTAGANGIEVFIDGVSMASDATRATDAINPTGDVFLGVRQDLDPDRRFGGSMDSLQIYSTALSSNQVTDIASNSNRATVNVTVNPASLHTVPGSQSIDEDAVLTFSSGNGNAVTVSDSNVGTDAQLQVSLSVNDGVLNLSNLTGITIVGGGDGTATLTFTGTESDINAAHEGMTFTPNADFNGAVTLDMTTSLAYDSQAHYTFEVDASDQSTGTAQDGTLENGASITNDAERGNVLLLDGTNDYVDLSGSTGDFASFTEGTIATWVNTSSGLGTIFTLSDSSDGDSDVSLIVNSDGKIHFQVVEGGGVGSLVFVSSATINDGEWHHIAVTVDNSGNHLYIDGVEDTSLTYWAGNTTARQFFADINTPDSMAIGTRINSSGPAWLFGGLIDDTRIYDRALSADEITALANDQTEVSDTVAITVAAVNDAPTITNLNTDTLNYTEGDGAVALDQGVAVVVSDVDSVDFAGGTLTVEIDGGAQAGEDMVAIRDQGAGPGQIGVSGSDVTYGGVVIGSFAGGAGVTPLTVTFNSNATATEVTALVQNITYENTNLSDPSEVVRSVVFDVTDGDGGSTLSHNVTINVTAFNDQATADLNGPDGVGSDFAVTFTEGLGAVNVADIDATISDPDNVEYASLGVNLFGTVDGASEQVTIGGHTFTIGVGETIVATVGSTNFELDFDGSGFTIMRDGGGSIPQADLQTLIRGITYENTSDTPTTGDRTINIIPQDSDGLNGLSSTSTISVVATNDAPTAVGESYNAFEGVPYTAVLGFDDLLLNDGDVEDDALTVNTTPVSGPSNGELVLNADGSFTYTANDNFNGTDSFIYEVLDGNGGSAQATATFTVAPREVKILFASNADVNNSKVAGIDSWESGEVLGIGDPNLSFEPVGSDGSVLKYMDLEDFSADGEMVLNGLHYVGISSITVGSANSVTLQQGDVLFVSQDNEVMTSSNSLAINAGDVVVFRADVAGDYSAGTFIHLLDQPGASLTTGISLVEKDVLVGDVTLQAGTFLFTQQGGGAENSIYHFSADDVGAGTTNGTVSTLISSVDIGVSDNGFVGLMLVSEDLYLDGTMVSAGSIITTLESKDASVGSNGIGIDPDELFYLTVSTTTMGSGTTSAEATVLFDGGDIGLNNVNKKIRAFTFIEEFQAPNIDPVITLSGGAVNYTEGDPATIIDAGIALADPDSSDFDGGLLLVDLDTTGTLNDRLAIRDEGVAAGQIGLTGTTVTYSGLAIGSFAGGTDGTVPLTITFNANADVAAIQALLRNITYENVSTNPDTNQRLIEFTLTDGDGGVSNMVAKTVDVDNNNAAPVLTGANDLNAIGEDAVANGGTLVSALIAGQVSDADPAALTGIAVIGVDNTNGDWQYSIDNGTTWTAFGAPGANNARLLADTSLVRFVPDTNWNGTVTNGITFHAWDQTDGVIGSVTDITGAGNFADSFDAVSYSNNDGSSAWTSDWMEFSDDGNAATGNVRIEGGMLHLDNHDGGAAEYVVRSADLSRATTASLSSYFEGSGGGSTDTVAISVSNDGGVTWTVMRQGTIVGTPSGTRVQNIESYVELTADMQFKFAIVGGMTGASEYINFDNIDLSYSGPGTGGSNSLSLASASCGITVTPVNDAAVIGGTDTGNVTEDFAVSGGNLLASGALSISDVDAGQSNFVPATLTNIGELVLQSNGNWTYTVNNSLAAVQQLDSGETLVDTFTVGSVDGTTHDIHITITGAEDAPVISGVSTGAVAEDGTLTANGALTITDVDASDNPISFADVASTVSDNAYGSFTLVSGTWTYTLDNANAAVQALDVGETLTDTITFAASDGSTQVVTITINGAEDAPVITGTSTGAVTEDGTLIANGTLTIADIDTSDNPISFADVGATVGDNAYGSFVLVSGTWTYTLDNANVAVQALDVGETLTDTITFTASDGSTQVVTITINGAEDAAVIGGVSSGAVAEDNTLTANGTLTIADVDTSDNPISFADVGSTVGDNAYGSFALVSGTWTFTLDNANAAVQALDVGETLNDTITFTASDGSTQVVTITINGAEDAPVIDGTSTGAVAEDGTLTTNGALTISDTDTSDNPVSFVDVGSTVGDNAYGSFVLASGTWTYTLDNANAVVQALDVGETLTDTITFTASDGSTQVVTITINGAEDAPVISSTSTGAVAEDGALTTNGTLTITDIDTSDNPVSFIDVASTAGDNEYGSFVLSSGSWTYTLDNANATVQALDVGETLSDTITFTASDGSTQIVTITINGAEDAPVIGGTSVGIVAEDGILTANGTLAISDVDTSDNPISFADVGSTVGDNAYGSFALVSGTWTYTLDNANAAVQALDVGETLTDTITFTASDGSTKVVTITINGAEDVPVIGGTSTGAVTEDGTLTANGALTITDVDTSDNPVSFADVASTVGDNAYGSFSLVSGTWTYTLDNANAAVQELDVGETLTDTITFTASDGSAQVVTIVINGAEDTPVISGVSTGAVAEDGTLTTNGTLTITDVDTSDNPISFADVASTVGDNAYGSFVLVSGTWTYTLDNANAAVQALDVGETLTDTITFTASDGSTQVVTITINGAEDAPVISGTSTGAVAEDGTLTANGTLTISDVDTSDNPISFVDVGSTVGDNAYGSFVVVSGTWTYTLDNANAAVQALDVGETLTDTITFTASDGSTQTVTITINGAEDAPVISGTSTGAVAEDGTLTANGALTITDVDTSDNPISFANVGSTVGDNAYGSFVLSGGTWTYTLDNSNAAVQALDIGETLTDTITFTASDGSTQVVTITINGAEDAPVIGGTSTGAVAEDGTPSTNGTLTITDVDTSDNPISFADVGSTVGDNAHGSFALVSGTWTYTLDNANAAIQALDVGETLTDTITFTASDGSTQVVTVTINGAEDASVIGGTSVGVVAEDGTLTASLSLTIADVDTSDNPISFNFVAPTLGDNGYGNFQITGNTWTYTLNNAHTVVQALDFGETLTDTFTFTASDGSTQVVTMTINGAEDTAVFVGTTSGAVTEDDALTVSDTLTIVDADASDNPISIANVASTPGNNGYGNFELSGSTWTYTLNNSHASVQALDVEEVLTDTFTFIASDGSAQTVTVTINGTEDAPIVSIATTDQVATEDTAFAFTFVANAFSDVDTSDTLTYSATLADQSPLPAWLSFDGATRTFSGTPTNADVGILNLKIIASDGSSNVVDAFSITVNNINDAPTGADKVLTTFVGTPLILGVTDFGFSDVDSGDSMTAVCIDSVPAAGVLMLSGANVTVGEIISVADVVAGNLVFAPASNESGSAYATLAFSVRDQSGTFASSSNFLTVDVVPSSVAIPPTSTVPLSPVVPPINVEPLTESPIDAKETIEENEEIKIIEEDALLTSTLDEVDSSTSRDEETVPAAGTKPEGELFYSAQIDPGMAQPPANGSDQAGYVGTGGAVISDRHSGDWVKHYGKQFENLLSELAALEFPAEIGLGDILAGLRSDPYHSQGGGLDQIIDSGSEDADQLVSSKQGIQVASIALSVGVVTWAARSIGLLTSLLATVPAWRNFDPLPVLSRGIEDENTDNEDDDNLSIEETAIEEMMSGKARVVEDRL